MRRLAIALGLVLNCAGHAQAQTTETTEVQVSAGTWYFAAQAFNQAGLRSGHSNVVQVACAQSPCTVRLMWDANGEADLAGYIIRWGTAPGVYTQQKSQAPTGIGNPGQLPRPTLRIRR